MPQYEHVPRGYSECASRNALSPSGISLRSNDVETPFSFTFEAIRPNLFRTTFTSKSHPLPPHPSAPQPKLELTTIHHDSISSGSQRRTIELGDVSALVDWKDTPVVSLSWKGSNKILHRDLGFRSYASDSTGIAHYTDFHKDALHVGLGEKAAPMDLSHRQFSLSATDSFGYNVYRTDPLYKHIPLLIRADSDGVVAMFSTTHSRGTWSVGSEMDGLWGRFKVYRQDHGGLEEYLIVGRTLKDVVRSYADLVGYPLTVPRWSLGYLSGGMKYSMLDEPRAADALVEFAEEMRKYEIPCSGFQMSSGYTVAETVPKTRNVFTWNRHRFPDPEAFVKQYHDYGIRILANIKPYILANHPKYKELVEAGALFTDPKTKESAVMRLWSAGGGESGEGGHIDFTSSAGFRFWYEGVRELKRQGIDAMWNDNNEYPLSNDDWQVALDKERGHVRGVADEVPNTLGLWGRSLHTELMGQSSHDALVDEAPEERPFILTRSATAGTMRYAASTWSGDNVTSWDGMKGANSLSLNAGVSLLHSYGHDIGGFEGPQPTPELLVRWVQLGIYSPRFAINCFKTSPHDNSVGDVIEPWMYPDTTPLIRATIKRRYEIIPYLYSLTLESHLTASPPQRWIGWGYESDPEVWTPALKTGEEQYWLGDTLLVGCVYEPGVKEARIYLPKCGKTMDQGYINLNHPHQYLSSGQWVIISSEWTNSIPLLAKVGGAIPVGKNSPTRMSGENKDSASPMHAEDDYRGVEIFPPQESSFGQVYSTTWYEDDGISRNAPISSFTVQYESTDEVVSVWFEKGKVNKFVPQWKELVVILPVGDRRRVVFGRSGVSLTTLGEDIYGRKRFSLPISIKSGGVKEKL